MVLCYTTFVPADVLEALYLLMSSCREYTCIASSEINTGWMTLTYNSSQLNTLSGVYAKCGRVFIWPYSCTWNRTL